MTIAEKLTRAKDDIDAVYQKGYDKGLAEGGGSDNSEIEEMLLVGDENYYDEGKQFYSPYKWISVNRSGLQSYPFTYTVTNNHPTLWLHVYVYVRTAGQVENEFNYYNYTLVIAPDQDEYTIKIEEQIEDIYIEGIRWSTDGV